MESAFTSTIPRCKASLLALAKFFAENGRIGAVPERGHKLKEPFEKLWLFKPGKDFRFLGFRHRSDFFITHGALKKTGKKGQDPDYRFAETLRTTFLQSIK